MNYIELDINIEAITANKKTILAKTLSGVDLVIFLMTISILISYLSLTSNVITALTADLAKATREFFDLNLGKNTLF